MFLDILFHQLEFENLFTAALWILLVYKAQYK